MAKKKVRRRAAGEPKFTQVADDAKLEKMRKELQMDIPSDFVNQGDDVVGFWSFEHSPIACRPRSAKVFDGNIEKSKPSILIIAELTKPCAVLRKGNPAKDEDFEEFYLDVAEAGEIVGIWGKPGMRAIRDLAGCETIMNYTGEKETGKPNPMKTFDVKASRNAKKSLIPITEDLRDVSLGIRTWLEPNKVAQNLRNRSAQDDANDNVDDDDSDPAETHGDAASA